MPRLLVYLCRACSARIEASEDDIYPDKFNCFGTLLSAVCMAPELRVVAQPCPECGEACFWKASSVAELISRNVITSIVRTDVEQRRAMLQMFKQRENKLEELEEIESKMEKIDDEALAKSKAALAADS